jgi:hypothetical protein
MPSIAMNSVSHWHLASEWLTVAAVVATACFTGLIWWLSRGRLTTPYSAEVNSSSAGPGRVYVDVSVLNRSDKNLTIEAVSVRPPWFIPVDENGRHFGLVHRDKLDRAKTVQQAPYPFSVKPDATHAFHIAIGRKGGIKGCKRVSIALHVLTRWPRVGHRRKVLTAILPASIRNSQ